MTPDGAETGEDLDLGLDVDVLRRRRTIVTTLAVLLLLLGTMTVAAYHFLRPAHTDLHEIAATAEKTVQFAIGTDYRYLFPFFEELDIASGEDDEYVVTGWVQVISLNGRSEIVHFDCTVVPGQNAEWMPGTLTLRR
jgi:hypothetical protein